MTRVGLIARADNRGLGQQTWAFHRNMAPAKTLVVDCPSQKPLTLHVDRFPGAQVVKGFPKADHIREFLQDLDVVYTAETGYGQHLWREAHRMGVSTVLHANYEFYETTDQPTVLVAASEWNLSRYPEGTRYLPVPIELDRLIDEPKPDTATNFLHVVGRPAIHDRNGTLDFLTALQYVQTPITVTITCQEPAYVGGLINTHGLRHGSHINRVITSHDLTHYWDLYRGQHALILPRRFGGLCLPANEALGSGMPVIMPNIDPNNTWLPPDWLVKATEAGTFQAKQPVTYYRTDPEALAAKIDQLATDPDFYYGSCKHAQMVAYSLSWPVLKPRYEQCLASA